MAKSSRKGKPAVFDPAKDGTLCMSKNNKPFRLYNPDELTRKSAVELREGVNVITGEKLTNTQKAYRAGILKMSKSSAGCYNASKKNRI